MKKKIYIAGAGGMLGKAFYEIFKDEYDLKCSDIDVNEDWLEFLDFRNEIDYADAIQLFKPDYLFHLGAHTNLEWCELNQDDTYLTNTLSVENATRIANSLNIPLLYISTAGIFDGKQELYDDWDTPNPLGAYARSKYMGERYVCENSLRYIICRAGWMMGGGPQKDKKFINKLVKQVQAGATELNIVNDKDGTPTYTYDFAKTVKKLIELELWGLYNCVCHGQTSRYEVAEEFLRLINREDIKLNAVNYDFFKEEYFAQRPASERLITKKLELRKVSQMQDWRDALKIYLENEFNHIKK